MQADIDNKRADTRHRPERNTPDPRAKPSPAGGVLARPPICIWQSYPNLARSRRLLPRPGDQFTISNARALEIPPLPTGFDGCTLRLRAVSIGSLT